VKIGLAHFERVLVVVVLRSEGSMLMICEVVMDNWFFLVGFILVPVIKLVALSLFHSK
jgi:hypothetical protein